MKKNKLDKLRLFKLIYLQQLYIPILFYSLFWQKWVIKKL